MADLLVAVVVLVVDRPAVAVVPVVDRPAVAVVPAVDRLAVAVVPAVDRLAAAAVLVVDRPAVAVVDHPVVAVVRLVGLARAVDRRVGSGPAVDRRRITRIRHHTIGLRCRHRSPSVDPRRRPVGIAHAGSRATGAGMATDGSGYMGTGCIDRERRPWTPVVGCGGASGSLVEAARIRVNLAQGEKLARKRAGWRAPVNAVSRRKAVA